MLSKTTQTAIAKYGREICERAFFWHQRLGYGASGIANEMDSNGKIKTTRQADAAINAGHDLYWEVPSQVLEVETP